MAARAAERRLSRIVAWLAVLTFSATVAGLILWDGWVGWDPDAVFFGILIAVSLPLAIATWWIGRHDPRPVGPRARRPPDILLSLTMVGGWQLVLLSARGVWPFTTEVYGVDGFLGSIPRPDNAARTAIALIVAGAALFGLGLVRRPRLLGAVRPTIRRALIVTAHLPLIVWVVLLAATVRAVEPEVVFDPPTVLTWPAWILAAAAWSIAVILWTIGLPTALRLIDLLAAGILIGRLAGFLNKVPIGLPAGPLPTGDVVASALLLLAVLGAGAIAIAIVPPWRGEDRLSGPGDRLVAALAGFRAEFHRNDNVPWKVDPGERPIDRGLAVGIHDRVRKDD